MKTDGTSELLPLNKKQKAACNIVTGVLLVVAGVLIILAATDVINAPAGVVAAPAVLLAFGLGLLISAIIARNSLSMWLAGVILSCGAVSLFAAITTAGYGNLYPIYIAAPGIGCCFSVWFAEAKYPQFKTMAFFGGLGAVFSLNSSGACGWGITGGILAAYIGACVIAYVVASILNKDKEDA